MQPKPISHFDSICTSCWVGKVANIIKNHSHTSHLLFASFLSGRRYKSLKSHNTGFKNSLFPAVIRQICSACIPNLSNYIVAAYALFFLVHAFSLQRKTLYNCSTIFFSFVLPYFTPVLFDLSGQPPKLFSHILIHMTVIY